MNKTLNRVLATVLSLLMVFSCMTAAFAVEDDESGFVYSAKGQSEFFTLEDNGVAVLDAMDKALAEADTTFDVGKLLKDNLNESQINAISIFPTAEKILNLTLDFRSIDGVFKSLDDLKSILYQNPEKTTRVYENGLWTLLKSLIDLGDIEKVDLGYWLINVRRNGNYGSRKCSPYDMFKELILLVNSNKELVSALLSNQFKTGILEMTSEEFLGKDGLKGLVKDLLVSTIYDKEKEADKYNEAYAKSVDDIIYDVIVPSELAGEDDAMPGFLFDETTTFNALLINAFNICWEKYLAPMLQKLDVQFDESNALAMSFKNVLKLDFYDADTGTTTFASKFSFDLNKDFSKQLNNFVGFVVEQIVPGFDWVESEDSNNIGTNVKNAALYIVKNADFSGTPYAAEAAKITNNSSFEDAALICLKVVIAEFAKGFNSEDVQKADSLYDIAMDILVKAATKNLGLDVTYTAEDDYLDVVSDILAYAVRNVIPLYDANDKEYTYGEGKELEDVLNSILTYYMFDKGFAAAFGVNCAETDSAYVKLDSIVAMLFTGEKRCFDSKTFFFGNGTKKGLLDSIFALDIQNILDITVIAALNSVQGSMAVKVIYTAVKNIFDNVFDTKLLAAYTATNPFDNALSNANLKTLADNFVNALYERRRVIAYPLCYLAFFALYENKPACELPTEAKAEYGKTADAVVKVAGKTLVKGVDYEVKNDTDIAVGGNGLATFNGIGNYRGSFSVPFTVAKTNIANVTVSVDKEAYEATGAAITPVLTVKNGDKLLVAGTDYTYSYKNNTNVGTATVVITGAGSYEGQTEKAVFYIMPKGTVTGIKASATTDTSINIAWTALAGATGYKVEYKAASASEWKVLNAATTATKLSITGLKANTKYNVRIIAYVTFADGKIIYADNYSATATLATNPANAAGLKVTKTTASYVYLSWTAVAGATSYQVYNSTTKKVVATVTTNKATIKSLTANKAYKFKVRALVKDGSTTRYGAYSAEVAARTLPAQVTGVKATALSSTSIKLTWTKLSGVTSYQVYMVKPGTTKWVKAATVTKNYATLKGLTANKTYKFKVRAITTASKLNYVGAYSSSISKATMLKKVSSVKATATTSSVTLKWAAVSGASGYQVYRSVGTSTKYTLIATTTKATLTNKKLKSGTVYNYKIRAIKKSGSKITNYGEYSSVFSVAANPGKVSGLKATAKTKNTITLKWKAVSKATKYEVLRSTSANGKYKSIGTTTKTTIVSKKLSSNTKYYYKVRAITTAKSASSYGAYSSVINAKTSK